jgi:hypothetical protein
MEKIENKKIIIGVGVVAVLIVAYYMMKKKKSAVENVLTDITTVTEIAPYTIQWKADPTGAVHLVKGGKKYGFMSPKAFDAYGRSEPKSATKEEVDAIPIGGYVDEQGKVMDFKGNNIL